MPKKRHQSKYSKPPSVAPASLSLSSSSQSTSGQQNDRSVNELLADLRRGSPLSAAAAGDGIAAQAAPSVPPALRQILQLPETPAPPPRRYVVRPGDGVAGRLFARRVAGRAPPGPPPPRSWVSLAQPGTAAHAEHLLRLARGGGGGGEAGGSLQQRWPLPGGYAPSDRSLVAQVLRRTAADWPRQRDWGRLRLYALPSRLRSALLAHVAAYASAEHAERCGRSGPGLSAADLRLVLAGPPHAELDAWGVPPPDLAALDADVFHLDLAGAVGRSLGLRELGDLLFPAAAAAATAEGGRGGGGAAAAAVQDSWEEEDDDDDDEAEAPAEHPVPALPPPMLLPQLTHLSLAVDPVPPPQRAPQRAPPPPASWKQLLALAARLPQLTHLSLAGWPAPSLTPNARFARVAHPRIPGRLVPYAGTGPYSHHESGLGGNDDWSEAVLLLRRLARALYRLEHLDLTGCGDWFTALRAQEEEGGELRGNDYNNDDATAAATAAAADDPFATAAGGGGRGVDWVGTWAKVTSLRLNSGYALPRAPSPGQVARMREWAAAAAAVERHIRAKRAGRGRWVVVERDVLPP
ncbi:hypothetical protein GGR56DRAFT_670943 [Xylariaceae sp. FL0804]|nr:hypothetical protein GGR56DRAFT_670943 [Xylariaceae sp. FL0804]